MVDNAMPWKIYIDGFYQAAAKTPEYAAAMLIAIRRGHIKFEHRFIAWEYRPRFDPTQAGFAMRIKLQEDQAAARRREATRSGRQRGQRVAAHI